MLNVTQASTCPDPAGPPPADQPAIACDDAGLAYDLAPVAVTGDQVDQARADPDSAGTGWRVEVRFTEDGQPAWAELTPGSIHERRRRMPRHRGIRRLPGGDGARRPSDSAPQVLDVITGPALIVGDFSSSEARLLAALVGHGPLPVRLDIESYEP